MRERPVIMKYLPILFLFFCSFIVVQSTNAQQVGLGARMPQQQSATAEPEKKADEIDYANPKEYVVADVRVTGSQFLDANSMMSMSGLKVNDMK